MSKRSNRCKMTVEDVKEIVRLQMGDDGALVNDHRLTLEGALVPPQRISLIIRTPRGGRVMDENEDVWLIGQEKREDGYRIVMREDGTFGLASTGFASDKHLILVGYYGGLKNTFLSM